MCNLIWLVLKHKRNVVTGIFSAGLVRRRSSPSRLVLKCSFLPSSTFDLCFASRKAITRCLSFRCWRLSIECRSHSAEKSAAFECRTSRIDFDLNNDTLTSSRHPLNRSRKSSVECCGAMRALETASVKAARRSYHTRSESIDEHFSVLRCTSLDWPCFELRLWRNILDLPADNALEFQELQIRESNGTACSATLVWLLLLAPNRQDRLRHISACCQRKRDPCTHQATPRRSFWSFLSYNLVHHRRIDCKCSCSDMSGRCESKEPNT